MTAALHNGRIFKICWAEISAYRAQCKAGNNANCGGAVRNALMGLEVSDIDLATVLKPDEVQTLCTRAGFQVIPTGIEFGTVTVLVAIKKFEVTSLRKISQPMAAMQLVAFGTSWGGWCSKTRLHYQCALLCIEGNIFDPFEGNEDIKSDACAFGDASKRICEDLLRVWRFFRFFSAIYKKSFDQMA